MNEKLLQFIWQFQYFNTKNLQLENGESLQIIHPGTLNTNQGPDFLEAKIKIENTTLIGNIELHIKSSDWFQHQHQNDTNYSNLILHVVWQNDKNILDKYGKKIPVIELQSLTSQITLHKYEQLMNAKGFVPCEKHLPILNDIQWSVWKERLAVERLEQKSTLVLNYLQQSKQHWEETFWWLLARNMGMKINTELFEQIAKNISTTTLAKHKNQIHQLEALLLGQANLLNQTFQEQYPQMLKKEYQFLQKKYQLTTTTIQPAFLRMRPANFPTIRLAQLAMLIHQSSHLFSKIKEINTIKEIKKLLDITANDYWNYHYLLDEPTSFKPKHVGEQTIHNIIINTIVPVLFSYGLYMKEQSWKDKAIEWLTQLNAEKNTVTNNWEKINITNKNAMNSQALIQLKNNYCNAKQCLACAVGNKILKQ